MRKRGVSLGEGEALKGVSSRLWLKLVAAGGGGGEGCANLQGQESGR